MLWLARDSNTEFGSGAYVLTHKRPEMEYGQWTTEGGDGMVLPASQVPRELRLKPGDEPVQIVIRPAPTKKRKSPKRKKGRRRG